MKTKYLIYSFITLFFSSAITPSVVFASEKIAKCLIEDNTRFFKGNCVFHSGEGGSFSLSNPNESLPIAEGVSMVNVYIVGKGLAEVRGLTLLGINSRWGEAKRSMKDKEKIGDRPRFIFSGSRLKLNLAQIQTQ